MRAARLLRYGLLRENFQVQEVPVPEPKDTEVLIRVHASACGPGDYKLARGDMAPFFRMKFPSPMGFDVSGVVVKVGQKCSRIKVGDSAYANTAFTLGTYSEYAICPEAHVALKPESIDHVTAACIPVSGLSAIQGLRDYAKLKPGQKILIIGGTGGVGSYAVQIAKAMGAYVAATASQPELVLGLGADEAINYREQDIGEVLKGQDYDVVFDCVGGAEYWNAAQKFLKKDGVYVTLVGDAPNKPLGVGVVVTTLKAMVGRKLGAMLGRNPTYSNVMVNAAAAKDLVELREYVDSGKVRVLLDPSAPFTLETVYDMFEKMQTNHVKGKLRLKVRDD